MCFKRRIKKNDKIESAAINSSPSNNRPTWMTLDPKTPFRTPSNEITTTVIESKPTTVNETKPIPDSEFKPITVSESNPTTISQAEIAQEPVVVFKKEAIQNPMDVSKPKNEPEPKKEEESTRYSGKYEVFPEAGSYKYRLKASNGEILIVSSGYSTRNGVLSGIQTLKKNVATANYEIITDKNDFSQFRLYTVNGSRIIANGEYYDSVKGAELAQESVKKFAMTDKIIQLDEIPEDEIRQETVVISPVEKNPNGRLEISFEDSQWIATLKASNSEVLYVTSGYASRASLMQGIEAINKEIELASFRVTRDKQNRFRFRIYSSNNQQLLVGQTYGTKENCFSAIDSVRRFALDAKVVDAEELQ